MKKWSRKVVLVKVETTYKTDANPTGAADAMLLSDVSLTPLQAELRDRNLVKPFHGADAQLVVGEHAVIEGTFELAHNGTSGAGITAPKWGALMRACGFAETVDTSVGTENVNYLPVSSGEESVTTYFNLDGTRHKLLGARGDVTSIEVPAPDVPRVRVRLIGLLDAAGDPAEAALPTPDFSGFGTPLPVSQQNTPTFTLHGFAAVMRRLELSQGNEVGYRNLVGAERVDINDRAMTGRAVIEAPALTTKDFFAIARTQPPVLDALALQHGAAAGSIVQVDAPKVQVLPPTYSEDEGITMLELPLRLVADPASAGDDELKITVK